MSEHQVKSPEEGGLLEEELLKRLKELLTIDENGLPHWKDINEGEEPYINGFHGPIPQLYFIWYMGGVSLPGVRGYVSNRIEETSCEINGQKREVTVFEMTATAGEIIQHCLQSEDEEIKEKLRKKIKESRRIMVGGVISVVSAAILILELKKLGFQGEIDFYDISQVPLNLIDVYCEGGFFNNKISIRTCRKDIFDEDLPKGYYDMCFLDVVLSYVPLGKVNSSAERLPDLLRKGGFLLVRERQEIALLGSYLVKKSEERRDKELTEFVLWLREKFGLIIEEKQVDSILKGMFSGVRNEDEEPQNKERWLEELFGKKCEKIFTQLTTPADPNQREKRIFINQIYQKTN